MNTVSICKLIASNHGYSFISGGVVFGFFDRQEDMFTAILLAGMDDLY
jgi:cytidylate kinase